jgi:hypothetical protein
MWYDSRPLETTRHTKITFVCNIFEPVKIYRNISQMYWRLQATSQLCSSYDRSVNFQGFLNVDSCKDVLTCNSTIKTFAARVADTIDYPGRLHNRCIRQVSLMMTFWPFALAYWRTRGQCHSTFASHEHTREEACTAGSLKLSIFYLWENYCRNSRPVSLPVGTLWKLSHCLTPWVSHPYDVNSRSGVQKHSTAVYGNPSFIAVLTKVHHRTYSERL